MWSYQNVQDDTHLFNFAFKVLVFLYKNDAWSPSFMRYSHRG